MSHRRLALGLEGAFAGIVVRMLDTIRRITDSEQLREIIGTPSEQVVIKLTDRLNDLTRQFIDASPFVCVATASPGGGLDVSPRGDPKGFVRVLDERTLLMPDRPGNRIADTLTNLLADDRIALLFLIPGVGDTFRVNGRAIVTDDRAAAGALRGRRPGTEARAGDQHRGGLHPVPQGDHPLRAVEPRAAHRTLTAAQLRRDPARRP